MNKRELAKVAKALVRDLPDCAAAGDLLLRTPLGPILRALCLERSGWEPRNFYVWVFFQPLCIPKTHVFFNLGWRLGGGTHTWSCDTPAGLTSLCEAIRREALPFLDRIQSPRDAALTAKMQGPASAVTQRAIAFAFARGGDYSQAIRELDRPVPIGYPEPVAVQDPEAKLLRELLMTDPAAAQRQLETWEAQTVRSLGLERFYSASVSPDESPPH
jgi:hypothetical protein